jgi:hypothetical protein
MVPMLDLNDVHPEGLPEPVRHDIDQVVARLRDGAETWVPQLFPRGRRCGEEWRLANIAGDPPRNTGSCVIALKGPHAGDWIDFDGAEGGGPISAIEHATGLSGAALIARAAEIAGVAPGAPARMAPPQAPAPRRDHGPEIARLMEEAQSALGTPVEAYLAGRGLALPASADVLFHPDLTHWETRAGYPAMLGVVRDRAGDVIGLHRTYLSVDAVGAATKADLPKPRMMLGRVAGGAVRLGDPGDGGLLGLCEGVETGLAVMAARPDLPVWATLSTSGLEQAALPPGVRRVILLADNDASGAGLRSAEAAARRLRGEGRTVVIAMPPDTGEDFNDLLRRAGAAAVADVVARAEATPEDEPMLRIGQHRPVNYDGAGASLPTLRADEGDLARAVERVWTLLIGSNRTEWLFRFAGQPTWVEPDDEGRPAPKVLNEERLRHMLARLANWRRANARGELVPAPPPTAVVKAVLATPDPALPVLAGIVSAPVFGRTGKLITTPGYHPDARLLYAPASGFTMPDIPQRPGPEEIAAARSLICDDLLGDFPFVSLAERAHVVALLLLGFLRGMIDGPTPLHLIEKPTPGTGATLMVDVIATILTGSGASVMTEGRDDEEWRKRLTAKLRQIPTIVLIDNLRETLDSAALAAALTAPFWEDRILGQSEMARLPIRSLWIATGNNPSVSNEMARRLVRIRLDARVERPWARAGFRHPDLMGWVRANRGTLVAACLTLCQAWIAAGRPRGGRTIGSYEAWAQVLGGVLEVVGVEGFLGNLDEIMEASDSEGPAWSAFVAGWWDRFGTAEVGACDLLEVALSTDPRLPIGREGRTPDVADLGRGVSRMRDRVFDLDGRTVQVRFVRMLRRSQRWTLALVDRTAPDSSSQSSHTSQAGCEVCEDGCEDRNVAPHTLKPLTLNDKSDRCEECEVLPDPYTRAGAHARAKREAETASHSSHTSHSPRKSDAYACEDGCEDRFDTSQPRNMPDWLREVLR